MMLGSSFKRQRRKSWRLALLSAKTSSLNELSIPIDLLIEILKRVPLKSLVKLIRVSKSWQSLLTSAAFISDHVSYNLSKTNEGQSPNFQLFRQPIDVNHQDCRSDFYVYNTKTMSKPLKIECPFSRNYFVVGSCDGLLCFYDFYAPHPEVTPLRLWNPSITRMGVAWVPAAYHVELTPGGFPKLIFGAGLDPISYDYMLVRIAYYNEGGGNTRFRASVYGLGVGKWRCFDMVSASLSFSTIRWRGVCLNAVMHWVGNVDANLDENDLVLRSILTFHIGTGEFGEIELPKEVSSVVNHTVRVVKVPRTRSCNDVLGIIHKSGESVSLWIMEQYGVKESWVKLFCASIQKLVGSDTNVGVINEELLAVQIGSGNWMCVDVRNDEMREFKQVPKSTDYVDAYVESLMLLGQGSVWPHKT